MDANQKYFCARPSIDLSIVIGLYNEEGIVSELLSRLDAALKSLPLSYEILIVDDGSKDNTLQILRQHIGSIAGLRVMELYRNVGQVNAISAGMSAARGSWIVMMDGDLQHNPSDIPRFLAHRAGDADLVASYREQRDESLRRKLITAILNRINRMLIGVSIADFGSSFRLIRFEIVSMLKDRAGYVHYNTPDLFIKARKFVEIPITQDRRKSGSSKWTLLMFVMFNLDILVTAMRPVLLAIWASIAGTVVGLALYLAHVLGLSTGVQALTGPVSIILISLLMFMLSVIWREIIRGRQLTLGTPSFLVREVYSLDE